MESTPLAISQASDVLPSYTVTTGQNGINGIEMSNGCSHYEASSNNSLTPRVVSESPRINDDDDGDGFTEETAKGKKKVLFSKLSNRSKYVLVLCCFAQMCSALAFAIIAPFYPHEAEKKGVSGTLVGLVFSVFELVNFTMSPLFASFMTRVGIRFVLISGIFVAGASLILFGTLEHSPPGMTFFTMSLVCRAFIALGFCAFTVANFAILSSEFPSSVATVFGVLETVQGIGLMSGPLFGSALYELGGFCAPFYCLGGLVLLSDVLIYFLLPEAEESKKASTGSMASLGKTPLVLVSLANVAICSIGISFLESTLSKYLEDQFDLRVSLVGIMFIISPAIYGVTMPLWGFFVDSKNIMFPVIIWGLSGSVMGFLLLSPYPWPQMHLWIVIVGLALLGLCYGPIFIGATKCIVTAALENGYCDNLDTFSLVSGLFYFSYCFGAFVGPIVGGFLTQHIGFPASYMLLSLMHVPNVLASIGFYVDRRRKGKHKAANLSNTS